MTFFHANQWFALREMALSDIPVVLKIENQCQPYPWSKADFEASINSRHQAQVLVLEQGTQSTIVAFVITRVAADEAELLNIAVVSDCQRQGLGKMLLQFVSQSFQDSIHQLYLEVRASNHKAISLYRGLDFHEVGHRPNYYPAKNGREHAIIMAKNLDY